MLAGWIAAHLALLGSCRWPTGNGGTAWRGLASLDSEASPGRVKLQWYATTSPPCHDGSFCPPPGPEIAHVRVLHSSIGPRSGFRVIATRANGNLDSITVSGLEDGRFQWFKVVAYGRDGKQLVVSSLVMTSPGPIWAPSRTFPIHTQYGFSWSPGSDRIAYIDGSVYQREDVSILDLSSGTSTRVTRGAFDTSNLGEPAWSPDGSTISYTQSPLHGGAQGDYAIWLVTVADGSTRRVTTGPGDWYSSWGGRGRLYFLRAPSSSTQVTEIWSVDPEVPGSERQVTVDRTHHKGFHSARASDDAIVYSVTSLSDGNNAGLRLLNPETGARTPLTSGAYSFDASPDWEPDGRHVTFVSNASGHFDVWSIDVVTKSLTQLTRGPLSDFRTTSAKWSPDGRRLAVLASGWPMELRIYDRATLRETIAQR